MMGLVGMKGGGTGSLVDDGDVVLGADGVVVAVLVGDGIVVAVGLVVDGVLVEDGVVVVGAAGGGGGRTLIVGD